MKANKEKNCTYSMGLHDRGYKTLVETSITFDGTPTEISTWGWIGCLIVLIMFIALILLIFIDL